MSFNNVSSGSSYYSPYSSLAQFQPQNQGPTNTGMPLDTPIVSTNPVVQNQNNQAPVAEAQNNPAPVVQPQVDATEQESSSMNMEIDSSNESSPEVHAPVQPLLQSYYNDPTQVNYDDAIVITKENKPQIEKNILPVVFHNVNFKISNENIATPPNSAEEFIPTLAYLKIIFQPTMTEVLKLYYQLELARATNQPNEKITPLEAQLINKLHETDKLIDQLKLQFPKDNQSNTIDVRCITWLVKAVEGYGDFVIPPYFTYIYSKQMHVMMYSVPEGYQFGVCTLKVIVDNFLLEVPFELDTTKITTNGRPLKFIIVGLPVVEKQNDQDVATGVKIYVYLDMN